jgi:hypothetical protein
MKLETKQKLKRLLFLAFGVFILGIFAALLSVGPFLGIYEDHVFYLLFVLGIGAFLFLRAGIKAGLLKKITLSVVASLIAFILFQLNPFFPSHHNRSRILGKSFSNSEIQSIEIFQRNRESNLESPEWVLVTKLSAAEQIEFMQRFDRLRSVGQRKCRLSHSIVIHLKNEDLKLFSCGNVVGETGNGIGYKLRNDESLIEKYTHPTKLN